MTKNRPTLEDVLDGTPEQIRAATIDYLRTHRNWYIRGAEAYFWLWNLPSVAIVVLGALTAILSAYGDFAIRHRLLMTVLPAMSSLLATLLIQFRVRDIWRLRELGRISSEELIAKAHLLPTDDQETAKKGAIELRLAAHQLERAQAEQFYADAARPSPNAAEKKI
jgi:hypothetical protein